MKHTSAQSEPNSYARRLNRTDHRILKELAPLQRADRIAGRSRRRFASRTYLLEVYRLYAEWDQIGDAEKFALRTASAAGLSLHGKPHPMRILIDLTTSHPNLKRRSKMERALRYALSREVAPEKLLKFFRNHGGISGCARYAAYTCPPRCRPFTRKELADWYQS